MAYAMEVRSGHILGSQVRAETGGRRGRRIGKVLWAAQGVLALVFLFTGATKLALPIEALTTQIALPGFLVRFIGLAEVCGALGMILPGVTRIRPALTPLAASGLVIIMIGATVSTLAIGGGATALLPAVVGMLAAFVAYGRTRMAPQGLAA